YLASDAKLAARLYEALLPRKQRFVFFGPLMASLDLPYARNLALLAEMRGELDVAVAHFEDAEARIARAGMRAHLARVWFELARALLARGGANDRARAAELSNKASALASALEQTGLIALFAAGAAAQTLEARSASTKFSLRRDGEVWAVEYEGRTL